MSLILTELKGQNVPPFIQFFSTFLSSFIAQKLVFTSSVQKHKFLSRNSYK